MVQARGGLLLRALAVLLSVLPPCPVNALFDSVWEQEDAPYVDDSANREADVTDLLHLIFSKSIRDLGAVLDTDSKRRNSATTYDDDADDFISETKLPNVDTRRNGKSHAPGVGRLDTAENTPFGIASDYVLKLDLNWSAGVQDDDSLNEMQTFVASVLKVPRDHVHLIKDESGHLGLYFVKSGAVSDSRNPDDLLRASEAESILRAAKLKKWDRYRSGAKQKSRISRRSGMNSFQTQIQGQTDMENYRAAFWQQPYFLVIVTVAATIVMGMIFLLIWCCIRRKEVPEKPHFPTQESALLSTPIPQQICLFPAAKPSVNNAMTIQPDAASIQPDMSQILMSRSAFIVGTPVRGPGTPLSGSSTSSPIYSSSSTSGTPIPGTPVHTPPLRIKARGLLERRGSNASLTIELGTCTSDSSHMGSPPKESTAEEYLLSAGNRMSRRQLQRCLYNVKAIYEEFWDIPMNHPDKIVLPGSGIKNRYRTIIPNEATRVILPEVDGDPLSTYINANYIRGYGAEPRSYIATQGPMANTVIDLWRTVWQEKAPIIVMITKLKEKNKNKCECYIPDLHDTFGDIDVHVEGITEKEGYIIRNIRLRYHGEEHEVLHYWYTAWPDHKAPNTARQLLKLVKEVEIRRRDPVTNQVKGPVVVHCSAGIGRTGCFIATSIGIQQLQHEHMVDILGTVCSMRLDRGGMVQTNEQYEFVHQALMLYERELPEKPANGH
ncbi:hypothetical protein LSH36_304g09034 [Paralvinella palmiformis]|uniref:protein-tyrosine-phosphatase n=1 Tax=Paralvinella palmiformis TaxID=53620 RepID=A0AAD9JIB5_9ANNE|nr:hypothetical protein LSH36_304g09034 [Paralvinella palmiformis]